MTSGEWSGRGVRATPRRSHAHSHTTRYLLLLLLLAAGALSPPSCRAGDGGAEAAADSSHGEEDVDVDLAAACALEYLWDGVAQFAPSCGDAEGPVGGVSLCECLGLHGIANLTLVGDGHMRHLFVAAATVLTGNFRDAALRGGSAHPAACEFQGQYSMREEYRRHHARVRHACGGAVRVKFIPRASWNARHGLGDPDAEAVPKSGPPYIQIGTEGLERHEDLVINNMVPTSSVHEWSWTRMLAGPDQRRLTVSASCRAWTSVRRYGSALHVAAVRRLHAANAQHQTQHGEAEMAGGANCSPAAAHVPERRELCAATQYRHGRWCRPPASRPRAPPACCWERLGAPAGAGGGGGADMQSDNPRQGSYTLRNDRFCGDLLMGPMGGGRRNCRGAQKSWCRVRGIFTAVRTGVMMRMSGCLMGADWLSGMLGERERERVCV